MPKPRWDDFDRGDADERGKSLASVAAVLFLLVASLIVVRKLQVRHMLEECVLAGRPACEASVAPLRVSRALDRLFGSDR